MAGDDLDLVSDERDSRLELAAFDERLAATDPDGFGDPANFDPDAMVADGLRWSDEAPALARNLAADARLERPRRPELSTKPFLQGYFRTLRLVDLGITRIDAGMCALSNLRKLSLSSNSIPVLTVRNLPPTLEVLNMYDCGIRTVRTTAGRGGGGGKSRSSSNRGSSRGIKAAAPAQLVSLLHLGVGYNTIGEEALTALTGAFPSLTSLDLSNNYLSDTDAVVSTLQRDLPLLEHVLLAGNAMAMEFGYRSRCIVSLPQITRFDDLDLDEDDTRAARRAVQRHSMKVIGADSAATTSGGGGRGGGGGGGGGGTAATSAEAEEGDSIDGSGPASLLPLAMAPPLGGQESGAAILRVKVGVLKGMPGPVVTRAEPSPEDVEALGEGAPPGPVSVSYKCPQTAEESETMLQDAEAIDLRYFLRLIPPGSKGLPQTTAAKVWAFEPGVRFAEFVTLCVPLSGDFAFDCQFKGLKVEIWASLPGKKEAEVCEEGGAGDGEGEAAAASKAEEKKTEGEEDEQASLAESLPPRVDTLVGRGVIDLVKFCDPMIDGMAEVSVSATVLRGPSMDQPDLLGLRDMQQAVSAAAATAAENASSEEGRGDADAENDNPFGASKMPTLDLVVALNPTEQPPAQEEEEEPASRPGTKGKGKGKKKKK
jgi:hypothetical protein